MRFASLSRFALLGALAACHRATAVQPGPLASRAIHVTAGGVSRTALIHVPANAVRPAPLVLNLHGSGGTAAGQERDSAMDAVADAHGFIVAYPQAAIALGDGFAWNIPGQPLLDGRPVPPGANDDEPFVRALVETLERDEGVDPRRVFVTGMSGGGRMTSQLGCDLPGLFAAIAPVAGLRFPASCESARALPVLAIHGTGDRVNPYEGHGSAYWTYGVQDAERRWAAHNACGSAPEVASIAPGVTRTAYAQCRGGADVWLYSLAGVGHEWPGGPNKTTMLDADETIWSFFAAHSTPR
jgi:polyhydroxybutyrate depolymerase